MAARLTTYVVVGIVAATLIAGLIVGAQRDDSDGPVDLIVFNAKVYTADASGSTAEAVAIRGNQICALAATARSTASAVRRPCSSTLWAPRCFRDSTTRTWSSSTAGSGSMRSIWSIRPTSPRSRRASGRGPTRIPIARGSSAGDGLPNRFRAADRRVCCSMRWPNRPAYILSNDGRAAWVNTKALQFAGITRKTPNPAGGTSSGTHARANQPGC